MTEQTTLAAWQDQSDRAISIVALTATDTETRDLIRATSPELFTGKARHLFQELKDAERAGTLTSSTLARITAGDAEAVAILQKAAGEAPHPAAQLASLREAAQAAQLDQMKARITEATSPEEAETIARSYAKKLATGKAPLKDGKAVLLELQNIVSSRPEPISTTRTVSQADGRGDFRGLDRVTGGLTPRRIYLIVGESSIGKTAFAWTLAENAARQGAHVLYFSAEMDAAELFSRSISAESYTVAYKHGDASKALTVADIYDNGLRNADPGIYLDAFSRAYEYAGNLHVVEAFYSYTASDIAQAIRDHRAQNPDAPILAIVDYLQIIPPEDYRKTDKQAADDKIKTLKNVAVDANAAVLALSSTRRETYDREKGMDAAKESGGLEYGADFLAILDRPHTYRTDARGNKTEAQTLDQWKEADRRVLELAVKKNRGRRATGKANFIFDAAHNYIMDAVTEYENRIF